MGGADPCGAYTILKWWYQQASEQAPNPSRTDTEKVRGGFHTLYQMEYPHLPWPVTSNKHGPVQGE